VALSPLGQRAESGARGIMIDPISRFLLRTRAAADGRDGDAETVVLMYHGVVARGGRPNTRFDVAADAFARQLDLLAAAGFVTARVADLAASPANGRRRVAITFDDGFRNNIEGAVRPLLDRRMTASWFVVSDFVGELASWVDGDRSEREILSAPELRAMVAAGLEVGSHTRRHLDLTRTAPDEIEGEVAGSKRDLELLLAAPVTTFAYPYGRLNDSVRAAVVAAGYVAACATRSGSVRAADDRYALHRVTITWHDTPSSFARKLALADNDVAWGDVARHGVRHLHARLRAGQAHTGKELLP
jgi:peptidoglycan/xylan/chitin deacetylase (PgdA/CDA1 family)